ncbi:hypothetical protein NQ318_005385 [Aromia moschata]|uniref:C2H2-type domain-containing protein n=1 Tax=Aromia moschata TaxID=1265417 RepID=A0AAV8YY64_9CUCU|nr:hypothetical protein NQ318_005385 [Aromia moschata]
MKIEDAATGDPIWTNNVELITHENLGTTDQEPPQNMDVIILPPTDLKLPTTIENTYSLQNNYIVLRENGVKNDKVKLANLENTVSGDKKKKENFEDMLYFVCNLCPFLCTKDSKITEHLENAHKKQDRH